MKTRLGDLLLLPALCFAMAGVSFGQDEPTVTDAGAEKPADGVAAEEGPTVSQLQALLMRDYERFEEALLKVAETTQRRDPDRAELLHRTRGLSTEQRVSQQMRAIVELLDEDSPQFGRAADRQEELVSSLKKLLDLLQSEDERDRIAREMERIKDILKDTDRLLAKQKDVRADTTRGRPADGLVPRQGKVAGDAEKLADKIDKQDRERAEEDRESRSGEQDGERSESEDAESGDSEQGESSDAEGEQSEDSPSGDSKSGDSKSGDSKSGDSPADSQPSESKPMGGQPSDSQPSQPSPSGDQQSSPQNGERSPQQEQTPGREQLEQSRQQMQRAIEELERQNADDAENAQDEAIAKLEEMKAELEEILRQLREEEQELLLVALEARFQKMLRAQLTVNAETLTLDKTSEERRTQSSFQTKATQLSRDERELVIEAQKAVTLLKSEGSSVAFPEAVEQMAENMRAVASRLQKGETAKTTQLLELMIVEQLEEMILALQKEIEKKQSEQQQQDGQQGQPQDPSLVDILAELKMIRSLQNQVNRLTRQYSLEIEGDSATDPDDLAFLKQLSGRQQRIQEATYDLSIGKNR